MIDPMLDRFDMPEEHGAGATSAHFVPQPVHFFPFFGRLLAAADFVPHIWMEDLGPAPGEGVQTRFTQRFQGLLERHFENALCQMADLDRRKRLDM